jgi:hypothetical protein
MNGDGIRRDLSVLKRQMMGSETSLKCGDSIHMSLQHAITNKDDIHFFIAEMPD